MPIATSVELIGRFARLSSDDRRLLLRASLVLTAASAAVALLPFRRAIRFGSVPLGRRGRLTADRCVWAVEAVARRLPWRTMCIEQGLAAQRILRASGIDAVLQYGARNKADEAQLEAHVWVTVDGEPVIGGREAHVFASIASFS